MGVKERIIPDPKRTKAYYHGRASGVYLNDKIRYQNGTVSKEEVKKVRQEIVNKLSGLKDPQGNNLFKRIYVKEEAYLGPNNLRAPDIVFEWNRYIPHPGNGPLFSEEAINTHDKNGIVMSNLSLEGIDKIENIHKLIFER